MCPDLEQLLQFALDALPLEERRSAETHFAECAACRDRLTEIQADLRLAMRARADSGQHRYDEALTVEGPIDTSAAAADIAADSVRRASFPGYQVLREISHGGQGVVYQALQEATKRKVAIKVLVEGRYASETLRKRFEREIELAAQLKHPNIVPVFHSGLTDDGRQYLVMDYVRGAPLNAYVRDKKLPVEAAVALFAQVCEAVQYAHQRGIIHRDIKPTNVLVDFEGAPRVLDFGLAKRLGDAVQTLATDSRQLLGTLPYMSPEQTRGNPDELDTRSDVYSLGIVLYELLTGQYPYPMTGSMADSLRHIAETPAAPLSRQWSNTSGITSRTGRRLRKGQCPIDDEVETIVLRALTKERERRYQSAGELARDLRLYLAGEPIEAKRDSGLYMLRKALRRYRTALVVAGVFIFVVAGFAVAMTLQSIRVKQERDRARDAEKLAENRLDAATAARADAERARRQAETTLAFLRGALSSADPLMGDPKMTVAEMLDRAAESLESDSPHDPLIEAAIRDTLGLSYLGLGRHAAAEKQIAAALDLRKRIMGDTHRDTLNTQNNLATVLRASGDRGRAEQLLKDVLNRGGEALTADPDLAFCIRINLAGTLQDQGRLDDADALYRQALTDRDELAVEHPDDVVSGLNGYARLLVNRKQTDLAQQILDESLNLQDRFLPAGHIYRIDTLKYLGIVEGTRGRLDQAEKRFAEARDFCRRRLPANDLRTLEVEHQLG